MAEPASDFVSSAGWLPASELTPTLGPPRDTAAQRDSWMLWAMLPPPPPPPSSSAPVAGSQPSSEKQPLQEAQALPEAPPPFDAQILPGAQPPFDAQSPLDSQPHLNGQPSWNFQASTSWYWRQSPGVFPGHQNAPGRLLLLSSPPLYFSSPLLPSLTFPLFLSLLLILPCTLEGCSFMSHNLYDSNVFPRLFSQFDSYLLNSNYVPGTGNIAVKQTYKHLYIYGA